MRNDGTKPPYMAQAQKEAREQGKIVPAVKPGTEAVGKDGTVFGSPVPGEAQRLADAKEGEAVAVQDATKITVTPPSTIWWGVTITSQKDSEPVALFREKEQAVSWAQGQFGHRGWSVQQRKAGVKPTKGPSINLTVTTYLADGA